QRPLPFLSVPLTRRDGRNMGDLQVSGKPHGDFSQEDEAILVQLAQMTSIAIENTLYGELREANRLKDEFLATVSHELRTPLSAMLSWVWMRRRGGGARERHGGGYLPRFPAPRVRAVPAGGRLVGPNGRRPRSRARDRPSRGRAARGPDGGPEPGRGTGLDVHPHPAGGDGSR